MIQMKKIVLTAFTIAAFTFAANAQEAKTAQTANPEKTISKEEKEKMKANKEAEIDAAVKAAGLTDEQARKVKDVLKDAGIKANELKKNNALTEEQKTARKEEINTQKNNSLKEVMGADKFKAWTEIRKKQKLEADAKMKAGN